MRLRDSLQREGLTANTPASTCALTAFDCNAESLHVGKAVQPIPVDRVPASAELAGIIPPPERDLRYAK